MYRNFLCAEAIILLILSHVGWNDRKTIHMPCSRDKSRIVRNIIYKKFIPILDRYRVSLPMDCPFHPHRDLLWWPQSEHELNNPIENDDGSYLTWTCPFCGQTFLCSERLAIHWDETHRPDFERREDSVCLADYCDIMRCDVMVRNRRKMRIKLKSESVLNTNNDHTSQIQCNASEMKILESRCKYIIRQCTVGMLSTLSLKDFQDIEDDLSRAICSYLRCDKFYDDFKEDRNVPLALCIAIGIIMIGGFCLCYYIVWMLFDSNIYRKEILIRQKMMIEEKKSLIHNNLKPINQEPLAMQSLQTQSLIQPSLTQSSATQSESIPNQNRVPISSRPKIFVSTPSSRFVRPQPIRYYYHPHLPQQQQYHSITEDDWESCDDIPTRTTTATSISTTAAVHTPDSQTSSQSNKSLPLTKFK